MTKLHNSPCVRSIGTESHSHSVPAVKTHNRSALVDGHAEVLLVGPLAVVVRPGARGLAPKAAPVLLLRDAARVVEGHAGVLRGARVVSHGHLALLVRHDVRVRAPGARVLLQTRHHAREREERSDGECNSPHGSLTRAEQGKRLTNT